jgi:hypothetical protein
MLLEHCEIISYPEFLNAQKFSIEIIPFNHHPFGI